MRTLIAACVVVASLLVAPQAVAVPRDQQCRQHGSVSHRATIATVRCAGRHFGGHRLVRTALRIGRCESGLAGVEAPHSDPYHGTYQYVASTFASQQDAMPAVVRGFDLSDAVHNMRANVVTAVAWMSKHGTGPWSCA